MYLIVVAAFLIAGGAAFAIAMPVRPPLIRVRPIESFDPPRLGVGRMATVDATELAELERRVPGASGASLIMMPSPTDRAAGRTRR